MNAAEIGEGLLRVREAHRYCANAEHGGHDFEGCPVLTAFNAALELPLTLERERPMRTRIYLPGGIVGWSENSPSENVRSLRLGGAMVTSVSRKSDMEREREAQRIYRAKKRAEA